MLRRGLGGALLVAAVLVPAASARSAVRVKLSLVPLPKAALGAAGHSLAVAHDSGVVSNAVAAGNSLTGTTASLKKLGRVTGYLLDYGDAFRGGSGVTAVETGVDRYRSASAAKHGLAFWKKDDAKITTLGKAGLTVSGRQLKAPRVGARRFAFLATLKAPGVSPVSTVDEQVADGSYVLEVSVAAGSAAKAKGLAAKLARKLDARLRQALAGRLHGKPVKLPPRLKPGAPKGGPDLSTLALTASDLGQATVADEGYAVDPSALSAYSRDMQPAGTYEELSQQIEWYPSTSEAAFRSAIGEAVFVHSLASLANAPGVTFTVTPVDVSSVGDAAQGVLATISNGTTSVYFAVVVLTRGQASDLVFVGTSTAAIQSTDVTSLALLAANRLNVLPAG